MNFLDSLQPDDLAIVAQSLETMRFPEGDCIIEQGSKGEGFYIIDEGRVRIEFDTGETDTDVVLRYLEPGAVMGEFSLVDDEPRSANAYAHTDVVARWLPTLKFQAICAQHPDVGVSILTAFCRNLADMVRQMTGRIADFASTEKPPPFVDEMIARAKAAQEAFQDWPEERVDALLEIRRIAELGEVNSLLLLETVTRQYQAQADLVDARLAEALAAVHIKDILGPEPAAESTDQGDES